jgi:hypothetical protein
MQNGPRRPNRAHAPRPPGFAARPPQWHAPNAPRPAQRNPQGAQRKYQHYMELARAEAASGNIVGAENYYQYAEHYFRMMNAGQGPDVMS